MAKTAKKTAESGDLFADGGRRTVLKPVRGKSAPGVDEITDAAIACFGQGNATVVSETLRDVLIGHELGQALSDDHLVFDTCTSCRQCLYFRRAAEATDEPAADSLGKTCGKR